MTFPTTKVTMAWDVSSTTRSGCTLDWTIQASGGQPVTGTLASMAGHASGAVAR